MIAFRFCLLFGVFHGCGVTIRTATKKGRKAGKEGGQAVHNNSNHDMTYFGLLAFSLLRIICGCFGLLIRPVKAGCFAGPPISSLSKGVGALPRLFVRYESPDSWNDEKIIPQDSVVSGRISSLSHSRKGARETTWRARSFL